MADRPQEGAHAAGGDDVVTFKNEADASTSLFDLRYLIGGLFVLYGVVLVVASFFISEAKSNGIDINLWLGLGMFLVGAFFLAWARMRPLKIEGRSALAAAEEGRSGGHDG